MSADRQETDRPYVVLIGDLVESRELADRAAVQERLRAAVRRVNERHGDVLAAPLALTGGDEVKTMFEDPAVAVDVIVAISEAMHPAALAWGLGRGPLETALAPAVGAMDGPCFHRARRAIEQASAEGAWGRAHGFSPLDDRVLSGLLRLTGALRSGWTERQRAYIGAVREGGRTQKEIAGAFGVSPAAVSMALQRARFRDVEEGEAVLRAVLAAYRPEEDA